MRDTRIALAPYVIAALVCITAFMWMAGMLHSQTPQAQTYKPTEVQQLKLQVAQRDAWLAQRDYLDAQRRYQQAVAGLNVLGEDIRKENGWPTTVIFNADKVEFQAPSPGSARPGSPGPAPIVPRGNVQ